VNSLATAFLLLNAVALLLLKRRSAPVPILIGTLYMTVGTQINVGPFTFTVIRMLIAIGMARVIIRRERFVGEPNALDWLMVVWGVWALASSAFHKDPSATFIFQLGIVYNIWGVYFLFRVFCQNLDDVLRLCRFLAILLVPLAVEMCFEYLTGHNPFSVYGGVTEFSQIREGRIRAQGSFRHPILAGTVGAVCLPLMVCLWQRHRKEAIAGVVACSTIVFASASSGPILSVFASIGALLMWRYRSKARLALWLSVMGYVGLELIMTDPAYFLLARVNVVGGSTGWHRAQLIRSALSNLSEWWLAGTDYTRHWMPTGVSWSADHSDITNYYLKMGVWGGLPLMMLFIATLWMGFSFVGEVVRQASDRPSGDRLIVWFLGASLFSYAISSIAVSYFDQSFVFLYMTLAVIGSLRSGDLARQPIRKALT